MLCRWKRPLLLWCFAVVFLALGQDDEGVDDPEPEEGDHGINQDTLSSEQIRGMHRKIDADGDGKISMVEVLDFSRSIRLAIAKKDVSTIVDEMDGDRDGKLSLEELLKDIETWADDGEPGSENNAEAHSRKELETQKFKLADRNGDGFLDMEELPAVFYPETHEGVLHLAAGHTHKRKDTDGNGQLSPREFWEGDGVDGQELAISKEEDADFARLDTDGSGALSVEELKIWESGNFHTEDAMRKLFELADKDNDMHATADELDQVREAIAGSDAQYHLMEWVEHYEL